MMHGIPSNLPLLVSAFHTFNVHHLVTLACFLVASVVLFVTARSCNAVARKWLGRVLGVVLLSYAGFFYLRQGLEGSLSLEYSLPLELCNIVLIAAGVSLFWPSRFFMEIAYFWGMGGVVQAMLTPDLATGFPSWDFVFFFWGHGATLLAIVFLIASPDFVPRKNSVWRMMAALNVYAIVVGSIDAVAGWNYGYLCEKPAMPSLLDWLGPWPWYLLSLEVVALVVFLGLSFFQRLLVGGYEEAKNPKDIPKGGMENT